MLRISCDESAKIDSAYRHFAEQTRRINTDGTPAEIKDRVHRYLESESLKKPWLLILDNVNDEVIWKDGEDNPPWPTLGGLVLITSTNAKLWKKRDIETIPLKLLSKEETLGLIRKRVSSKKCTNTKDLEELAEYLDGHPLVIDQAASYIGSNDDINEVGEFLRDLKANIAQMVQDPELGKPRYENKTLGAIWKMQEADLQNKCPNALEFIRMISCLGSAPIPYEWVKDWVAINELPEGAHKGILRTICDRSIVARNDDKRCMRLHSLKKEVVLASLLGSKSLYDDQVIELAQNQLRELDTKNTQDWNKFDNWLAHTRSGINPNNELEKAAWVGYALGSYCAYRQNLHDAKNYLGWSLKVMEKIHSGDDCPALASLKNDIGVILSDIGDYPLALKAHYEALMMRIRIYGDHGHPLIASSLGNLGSLFHSMGENTLAIITTVGALEMEWRLSGYKGNSGIAIHLDNLAGVYSDIGAEDLELKLRIAAVKLFRSIYKDKAHIDLVISLRNLGIALSNVERNQEAATVLKEAVEVCELLFEKNDHPHFVSALSSLSKILILVGEYKQAREIDMRALGMCERIDSYKNHTETVSILQRLSLELNVIGEHKQALGMDLRALEMSNHLHNHGDYEEASEILHNMGRTYSLMGEHKEAIEKMLSALQIEKRFNVERIYKDWEMILIDIANEYSKLGNQERDQGIKEFALSQLWKLYKDDNHPEEIDFFFKYLGEDDGNENLEKALKLKQEIRKIFEQTKEEESLVRAHLLLSLGSTYCALNDSNSAQEFFKQAIAIHEKLSENKDKNMIAESLIYFGDALEELEQYELALQCNQQSLRIKRCISENSDTEEMLDLIQNISSILDMLGRKEEAEQYDAEAQAMEERLAQTEQEETNPLEPSTKE